MLLIQLNISCQFRPKIWVNDLVWKFYPNQSDVDVSCRRVSLSRTTY